MNIDFTEPNAILTTKNENVEELKRILRKLKDNRTKKNRLKIIINFFKRK